jgi:Zn-dependent protease with chaperone function
VSPENLPPPLPPQARPPASAQWEGVPWALIVSVVILIVLIVVAYRTLVPMAAGLLVERVPDALVQQIGDATLVALDAQMFEPSALEPSRQADLVRQFERLEQPNLEIVFRKSPSIGPNAMALPSGTIVVTDELVALAKDDREILGTLAHEAGHVARRHGVRLVLQNSLLALTLGFLIGDYAGIVAGAPAAMLEAKYSRDLEREADAYGAALLRAHDIPPGYLAVMLERLEASQGGSQPGGLGYLSSHPATEERLDALRGQ